jgi:quinohemoprotein ethanol dehydrogenase
MRTRFLSTKNTKLCSLLLANCQLLLVTLFSLFLCLQIQAQNLDNNPYSPVNLAKAASESWPVNGGSTKNQRYSILDQINRNNVSQLKGVWRHRLDGSGADTKNSGEAEPIFADGKLYIVTGDNDVFAIEVASGERLWTYNAELPEDLGKSICCGWTNRGLSMNAKSIFVGQLDARLVAINKDDGSVRWSIQAAPWQDGYSITSAPLYYDGMVITGFAGAEYGIRGMVKAFDADTGEELWNFYTVPGPGEFGHETWPADNDAWRFGGGSVWQTPAADPELGLVYFSTGNPGPDFDGSNRAGDNLFTASVVALDIKSGEYRWHFQQVHHDIWDYDAPNPVILFDMEYEGQLRHALAQASKTGWVYILDRQTGTPIIGIEERPVPQEQSQQTATTQPYPVGDSFVPQEIDIPPEGAYVLNKGRIFTAFGINKPSLISPSIAGGANWPPSAYDPIRNQMFICAADTGMTLAQESSEVLEDYNGELYTGGGFGGLSKTQTGVITAMDMATNTKVWQWRWGDTCYSGFVATAGDLLFVGRNDGRLTALDTETGRQLWEFQTGAGMNSTISTFTMNGKQYVAAYSAGNLFAGSAKGDSLWLFSLDGDIEQTTPGDSQLQLGTMSADEIVMAEGVANLVAGETLFKSTCMPCHGEDGMGGHNNGMPLNNVQDLEQAVTVITQGRNAMPAFRGALTPEQMRDVSTYIIEELFAE